MRHLLALFLLVLCSAARAEWNEVEWQGDRALYGAIRVFVDYSSIQRTGNTVTLRYLSDYAVTGNIKAYISNRRVLFHYYSTIKTTEYTCSKSELRDLAITYLASPMGKGTSYDSPQFYKEWREIKNEYPMGRAVAAVACNR